MNVQQLIDRLKTVKDKDSIVVMSSDPEGNSFSELYDADTSGSSGFVGDRYGYEVKLLKLDKELREMGYTDEDVDENAAPAVVLWPR